MFELTISGHICSAHFLKGYNGPCKDLHGHTWKIEATIFAQRLDDIGLVADFQDMKQRLHATLEVIDHVCLNDLPYFKENNPSTENIARYVHEEFSKACLPFKLKQVRVWESDTASITYFE